MNDVVSFAGMEIPMENLALVISRQHCSELAWINCLHRLKYNCSFNSKDLNPRSTRLLPNSRYLKIDRIG